MKANFETGLKICSKCRRELPLSSFTAIKSKSDGLSLYCKECSSNYNKEWRKKNHDRNNETQKRYQQKVLGKHQKEYKKKNHEAYVLNRRKYRAEKRKNFSFRIEESLRNRVRLTLKGVVKSDHTLSLLGCSIEEFRKHIESQFQEGMTWENYGKGHDGWHLDHIIPIAYFDLSDPEQQKLCWNYRNFQPLWAEDNLKKKDKVPDNVEELIELLKQKIYE